MRLDYFDSKVISQSILTGAELDTKDIKDILVVYFPWTLFSCILAIDIPNFKEEHWVMFKPLTTITYLQISLLRHDIAKDFPHRCIKNPFQNYAT